MCSVLTTNMSQSEDALRSPEAAAAAEKAMVTSDEDEDLSVGSPEERQPEEDEEARVSTTTSTTAALRGLRKRKTSSTGSEDEDEEDEEDKPLDFTRRGYFLPFKRLEMTSTHQSSMESSESDSSKSEGKKQRKGVAGFSIDDILSHKTAALKEQQQQQQQQQQQSIVRPWDIVGGNGAHSAAAVAAALQQQQQQQQQHARHGKSKSSEGDSPLDALFQMASKTFEGLKAKSELDPSQLTFTSKQPPKKKRKSRTAFTNHQIFELEKRFLYQKYLSPADRDEIAAQLGLSNAQVITWFQNRRAKLKRDMEELRKDVECTTQVLPHALVGHQQHVAAAVAASVLASRNAAAAAAVAVSKSYSFDLQRPHLLHAAAAAGLSRSEAGSSTSLISPRSPPDSASVPADSRSPPIRVTDSDG